MTNLRIGHGYDVHRLTEGRRLILGGVDIGDNTVIGAGSVVTKSIPANVIAVGSPCRVLRPITEKDKTGYTW